MEQQGVILQRQRVTVSNKVRCFSKCLDKIKASRIDQNKQFSRAEIIALESRITEFQNLKAEFDTVQAEIEVLEDVDIEEQLVERENFDADFYMYLSEAKEILEQLVWPVLGIMAQKGSCAAGNTENSSAKFHSSPQLSSIPVPKFNGNLDDWLSFGDTFISLIHTNNSLDNIQKFHFLRTSLVEDAGQVIADAEFSAEGYQVAWQLVNYRHNKVALLVNHNLKKLTMCSLKHLGINTENWDPIVVFLLTEKLDPRSRREWGEYKGINNFPSIREFKRFLRQRIDILESVSGLAVGNKEVKWRNKQKSENHNSKSCSSKGCKTCGSKHHSLLHFNKRSKPNDQGPTSSAPIATDAGQKDDEIQQVWSSYAVDNHTTEVLLSTAQVKIWGNDGKHHMCRILLDSGSQVNLISERLTKLLGSETSSVSTSIMGINQVVSSVQKRCVVKVGSLNSSFSKTLSCLIVPKIGDDIPNGIVKTSHLKIPDHLTLADRKFMERGPIDLLVGAGEFYDFLCIGQYHLGQDQPVMQKTKVGWIVSGPVVVPQRSEMLRCHFVTNTDVAMDLEKFWKIEEPNPSKDVSLSDEDIACERFFIETTTRDKDGKFVVKIPLCAPIEKLGDSKASALKKYLQLERRLEKNPMMKDRCIRQVGLDNLEGYPEAACVIMNNFYVDDLVFSDDSSGKAVQVCREVDLVLKRYGFHLRKWISNIPEVVTKIGGDDSSEVIVDFGEKGTTKTLGLYWAVSKDMLNYCIKLSTSLTLVCREVDLVLKRYGFHLRKWISNIPEVVTKIGGDDSSEVIVDFGEKGTTKTLGLYWAVSKDMLNYCIKLSTSLTLVTKRTILSEISRIFDPLGLISPCVILVKILLQELWMLKLSWEDTVPSGIAEYWKKLRSDFYQLETLNIQRQIVCREYSSIQLHGFCDASSKAYGAAVYLRSVDASGSVQVSLVAAKSRVAPLKALTIPRLELCGALVLVELVQRIKGALTLKIDSIYLWCDSTVVLSWIATSPHLLQTFVSNRVAKIQELSQGDDWYHVKTDENPADLISRGVPPGKLIHNELWFNGPSWLTREEDSWCKKDFSVLSDVPEMKKQCQVLHVAQSPRLIDFRRFSSFQKLVRSFAYCLRFSNNTRRKSKWVGHLTSSELESSLHSLLKLVQKETFSEELRALEKGSPVKPARLLPLTPFWIPQGCSGWGVDLHYLT
nr:unnamed protein product [Callosobruchus analis]